MKFRFRTAIPLLFLAFSLSKMNAQPAYMGWRVAIFDLEISEQKNQSLSLRCRMANTGRQTIMGEYALAEMVVEFDTLGLPSLLRGYESAIAEAARGNCPTLKPGEVSEPVWLNLRLKPRAWEEGAGGCAEIVFDTAFVEVWSERTMRLRYFLKNTGEDRKSVV